MKILQTKKVPEGLVYLFDDDCALYVLILVKGGYELHVFDSQSFERIESFSLGFVPNRLVRPCVDDDCIYFPTALGTVLAVDKFSGKILTEIDLGQMSVISEPMVQRKFVYSLCGVPISNFFKTETNMFCVSVNDKFSGAKLSQSQLINGTVRSPTIGDKIWLTEQDEAFQFDLQGQLEHRIRLPFVPNYPPIAIDRQVIFCSDQGLVAICDVHMNITGKLMVANNSNGPLVYNNQLFWGTQSGIFRMLLTPSVEKMSPLVCEQILPSDDCVYGIIDNTCLKIDPNGQVIDSIESSSAFLDMRLLSGSLFLTSEKEIYQICPAS